MPKYSAHIIFNFLFLILIILLYDNYPLFPLTNLQKALFLIFYFIGTVILSPDIDIRRDSILFTPYRLTFKHRGLSHHYLWGILSRIIYVILILTVLMLILLNMNIPIDFDLKAFVIELIAFSATYINEIVIALLGLFLSNALHILIDSTTTFLKKQF